MEYQKSQKFVLQHIISYQNSGQKSSVEVNDDTYRTYNTNSQIKFKAAIVNYYYCQFFVTLMIRIYL